MTLEEIILKIGKDLEEAAKKAALAEARKKLVKGK